MLRFFKQYKVEVILLALLTISLAGYMYMQKEGGSERAAQTSQTTDARQRMEQEVDLDGAPDAPGLSEQMYLRFATVSRELYRAYQIKNAGESVTAYHVSASLATKYVTGKKTFTVRSVEKLPKEQEVQNIQGYTNLAVTVEINNEGGPEHLFWLCEWTCLIVDENGRQREEYAYRDYAPRLVGADCELNLYSAVKGADDRAQFVPTEHSGILPHILIGANQRMTLRVVFFVPDAYADMDALAMTSGLTERNIYKNTNYAIYLNRRKEE